MPDRVTTLGEWLAEGPFGLAMSSGFFAFYAHTGMLQTLVDHHHRPTQVSGSSAGALVGGAWAAGVEPASLAATLGTLARRDFWDPTLGAGLLAGQKFDAMLRRLLPVATFEACRVPTRISVFDIVARRTEVLTQGDLSDAIRASCCVPVMFHPVRIAGRSYWDGGILDRPGIAGLPPGERLLVHHIASQSTWRRTLSVPRRPGMITLIIDGLPRSGPFKLDAGRRALEIARAATARALDTPIAADGAVRITA